LADYLYISVYVGLVIGENDKRWVAERCPLWVAHWGTLYPLMPNYFTDYWFHQYSAEKNGLGFLWGVEPGFETSIDLNYCHKDRLYSIVPPVDNWHLAVDNYLRQLEPPYTGPAWIGEA